MYVLTGYDRRVTLSPDCLTFTPHSDQVTGPTGPMTVKCLEEKLSGDVQSKLLRAALVLRGADTPFQVLMSKGGELVHFSLNCRSITLRDDGTYFLFSPAMSGTPREYNLFEALDAMGSGTIVDVVRNLLGSVPRGHGTFTLRSVYVGPNTVVTALSPADQSLPTLLLWRSEETVRYNVVRGNSASDITFRYKSSAQEATAGDYSGKVLDLLDDINLCVSSEVSLRISDGAITMITVGDLILTRSLDGKIHWTCGDASEPTQHCTWNGASKETMCSMSYLSQVQRLLSIATLLTGVHHS